MNATIEYLELLRDALAKRAEDVERQENYKHYSALDDAAEKAQELIDALRELERFA